MKKFLILALLACLITPAFADTFICPAASELHTKQGWNGWLYGKTENTVTDISGANICPQNSSTCADPSSLILTKATAAGPASMFSCHYTNSTNTATTRLMANVNYHYCTTKGQPQYTVKCE